MKNKKGFTLIELLAVIVILAIIALIATPIVVDLIEDSRKSANENAVNGIVKSAEVCYGRDVMNDSGYNGSTYECSETDCSIIAYHKFGGTCSDNTYTTEEACTEAEKTWTWKLGECSDNTKITESTCTAAEEIWTTATTSCPELDFKGSKPTAGKIEIDGKGKIKASGLVFGNYTCDYTEAGVATCNEQE